MTYEKSLYKATVMAQAVAGSTGPTMGGGSSNRTASVFKPSYKYAPIYRKFSTKPSDSTSRAQDLLVNVLFQAGIWQKFDGFLMLDFVNGNYTDLLLNWITLTYATKSDPVTGESTLGTFTDQSTGYINTEYNPYTDNDNMSVNNVSAFVYLVDEFHEQSYNFGCYDGTNGLLFYPKRRNGYFSWTWANTSTYKSILNNSTVAGLCGFSQKDGELKVYTGGAKIGEDTVTPSDLPDADLTLFMSNIDDSFPAGIMNRFGMFMWGQSLTEDEFDTLTTAIDTYRNTVASYPDYYENDYIYYKREAFHVDCQRDDFMFGTDMSNIYHSSNGGESYSSLAFSDADDIEMSYIFENGDVIFATKTKIYRAPVAFGSYSEITVTDIGGGDYTPHVPANANYPGNYFRQLNAINPHYINGTEVVVWGNYGNIGAGANPSNIYYTKDNGVTIKIAYKFGQNPFYRDDGTYDGGETGTLLGDAGNPTYCRHVHSYTCDEANSKFYITTGDFDRAGPVYENHWIEGDYNIVADSWIWSVLVSDSNSTRYKTAGARFLDGYIYFASDATDGASAELGVFKCLPADIANTGNHVKLYTSTEVLTELQAEDTYIITANLGSADNKIYVSNDLGQTWHYVTLSSLSGDMRFNRIHIANSDGWFRMDIEGVAYYDSYPVYIKFK